MAQICQTVTTWVTQSILEPVDQWVSQQQQKCEPKWWAPWSWLCWFVWVLIRVVIWVTREILVPITHVVCRTVTSVVYVILSPFIVVIDVTFGPGINAWFRDMFYYVDVSIEFVDRNGPDPKGYYLYRFTCKCKNGDKPIQITALNDQDAAAQARKACTAACK